MTGTQAVNSSASRRLQNIGVFFGRQFVIAASTARRGWIDGHGAARAPGRESRKVADSHAERNCQTIVGSIDVPILVAAWETNMHSVFAVIAVLAVLYLGLRLTMAWLFPYRTD